MSQHITVTLLLAVMRLALPGAHSAGPFGRYIVYLDSYGPCGEGESSNRITIQMSISRFDTKHPFVPQKITGNATVRVNDGFDDSYWANVRMDSRWNSEWKQNAFIFNFPKGACSSFRDNVPGYSRLLFGDDVVPGKACKLPSGTYTYTDQPVNWTFPRFPVMPFGHWRARITVGRKQEKMMCGYLEAHLIPRQANPFL